MILLVQYEQCIIIIIITFIHDSNSYIIFNVMQDASIRHSVDEIHTLFSILKCFSDPNDDKE